MNDVEYYQAQVPEPWTLLGLRLRPLSAGHIILLNRVESPFVKPGTEITFEDLTCAVFICAHTFEETLEAFDDPELPERLSEWHTRLAAEHGEIDLQAKAAEFQQYLEEGSRSPSFNSQGEGGVGDVPSVQLVKAFLMSETNMTEAEILNRPWRLSVWDVTTIQALRGKIQFVSSEALGDAQEVGRRLADLLKSGKVNGCPS